MSREDQMLPPEVIERLKREREERERPAAQIPLYVPEMISPDRPVEEKKPAPSSRIIVIDMA